jgi:hypothetical protein
LVWNVTSSGTPAAAPRRIAGPGFRQIEPRRDRQRRHLVGDRQADQDLTVRDLAQFATVLAGHADRVRALLGHSGLVHDPAAHRAVRLKRRQDLAAHRHQHRLVAPRPIRHEVQQLLVRRPGGGGRQPRRHRFHALAPAGKQQPGAIIPERPLSASVLKGTRQAVKIILESPLIVTQGDIVTHHPYIGASKLRQDRPVPEISIKFTYIDFLEQQG